MLALHEIMTLVWIKALDKDEFLGKLFCLHQGFQKDLVYFSFGIFTENDPASGSSAVNIHQVPKFNVSNLLVDGYTNNPVLDDQVAQPPTIVFLESKVCGF